jgi:hypothetical protein
VSAAGGTSQFLKGPALRIACRSPKPTSGHRRRNLSTGDSRPGAVTAFRPLLVRLPGLVCH